MIKFRAWYKDEKIMIEDILLGEDHFKATSPIDDEVYTCDLEHADAIMQYTGLTDKNGKEIWEGDVVKASSYTGEVVYVPCSFYIRDKLGLWVISSQVMEVIGNIFENPELLKQ